MSEAGIGALGSSRPVMTKPRPAPSAAAAPGSRILPSSARRMTEPTELISTDGDPSFSPISETDLLYVENSENDIFLNIDSQEYFILISGRWYKSTSLDGGWSFVESSDLPSTLVQLC